MVNSKTYTVKNMPGATVKRGRPPKFPEHRRPITVTLPESTLAQLEAIDTDRARAIVKATRAAIESGSSQRKPVELVEVAPGLNLIVVGPSQYLRKIKWLHLIEIAPLRFLLTMPSGTAIDSVELAIIDLLQLVNTSEIWERSLLEGLRGLMRDLRNAETVSTAELLFVGTNPIRQNRRRKH
jgi:hypothetical protein